MFSPGSYGHAELYELSYPEKKVIDAINQLKNSDNELRVPKVTLDLGHWKDVNDDFGFFENREIKKNFEETILERVRKNLERGL